MKEVKSKMEAKVRKSYMLKEKINLLPLNMSNPLSPIGELESSKHILCRLGEEKEKEGKTASTFYRTKRVSHLGAPCREEDKFWRSSVKFHPVARKPLSNRTTPEKEKEDFNWRKVLIRSESLLAKRIKKRIDKFEHCSLIISQTVQKLQEEEQQLVARMVKGFGINL